MLLFFVVVFCCCLSFSFWKFRSPQKRADSLQTAGFRGQTAAFRQTSAVFPKSARFRNEILRPGGAALRMRALT